MQGNVITALGAKLDASLCLPQKTPLSASVDPTGVDLKLDANPSLKLSALDLDLPKLAIDPFTINITPPTVTLKASNKFAGLLGIVTGSLSAEGALQVVTQTLGAIENAAVTASAQTALDAVQLVEQINTAAGDPIGVGAALGQADAALSQLIQNNNAAQQADVLQPLVALEFSPLKIEVSQVGVDLGKLGLGGAPKGQGEPVSVSIDARDVSLNTVFQGLQAALKGCLVLNGGKADEGLLKAPGSLSHFTAKVPVIEKLVRRGRKLEIHGQHFGAAENGRVVLRNADNAPLNAQVEQWEPHHLRLLLEADEEAGVVQVVAAEQWSNAHLLPRSA
jgi:hypothetical protein